MAALDGQQFSQQPDHIQAMFRKAWNVGAESMWELQHNIEIGKGPMSYGNDGSPPRQITRHAGMPEGVYAKPAPTAAPTPATTPGQSSSGGTGGEWIYDLVQGPSGWMAVRRNPKLGIGNQPIPASDTSPQANYARNQTSSPAVFGNTGGQGPLFTNTGANLGPAASAFLRSDAPGTGGLSTGAENYSPEAIQEFKDAYARGQIKANNDTARQLAQRIVSGEIGAQQIAAQASAIPTSGGTGGTGAGAGAAGGSAAGSPTGVGGFAEGEDTPFGAIKGGLPGGFGLEWQRLLFEKGEAAAERAFNEAVALGRFNGLPTIQAQALAEQIRQNAVEEELKRQLQDEGSRHNLATEAIQRATIDETYRSNVEQEKIAWEKVAQAERMQDRELAQQWKIEAERLTFAREELAQQADQFGQEFGLKVRQQGVSEAELVAGAVADPRRFVEGNALATVMGTANGGPAPSLTSLIPGAWMGGAQAAPAAPTAGGAPAAPVQSPQQAAPAGVSPLAMTGADAAQVQANNGQAKTAQQTQQLFGGAPPSWMSGATAGTPLNPIMPISPNLNATLAGKTPAAWGNTTGFSGSFTPLANVAPKSGDFGKLNPVSFQGMDDTTRKQYESLALSKQFLSAPDLEKKVMSQLPGQALNVAPAAWRI